MYYLVGHQILMQICVSVLVPIAAHGSPSTAVILHTKHSSGSSTLSFVMFIRMGNDSREDIVSSTEKLVVYIPASKSTPANGRK